MKAETERTEIIQGARNIRSAVLAAFSRARKMDVCVTNIGAGGGQENQLFVEALVAMRKRGVKPRMVTEVTSANFEAVRTAYEILEIRHVPNLKANFMVTDSEYLSAPSPIGPGAASLPVVRSNATSLVEQHQFIFENLWSQGEPALERIEALETGKGLPEIEVTRDPERIRQVYLSMIRGARRRILILLPTSSAFHRDDKIGVVAALEEAADRGVKVRLLTPIDQGVLDRLPSGEANPGKRIVYRAIPPAEVQDTVTAIMVDSTVSLTIDERDPTKPEFDESVGVGIIATGEPRVRQSVRFFERSWMETELREAERVARIKEERSRRQAELMQDIMTHDIRNFNQVARLNAELLESDLKGQEAAKRVSAIIRAVDGSSRLIERTKKLGSIIAAEDVELRPVSLSKSFDRCVSLVRKANPGRRIRVESSLRGSVLADGLLDEIFVNLLSNAVKYTDGKTVRIRAEQETADLSKGARAEPTKCWKVSISDWGRGIPESMKPNLFRRYLESAKGSGLGLSIVHALTNDRYEGKVTLRNRVEGDYSKGTVMELWLPKG